jgi:hypothetical protein
MDSTDEIQLPEYFLKKDRILFLLSDLAETLPPTVRPEYYCSFISRSKLWCVFGYTITSSESSCNNSFAEVEKEPTPSVLYHHTNSIGFHGILNSGKVLTS